MIKNVDLLVYGPCSNAGDVLIQDTIEKLFKPFVNFNIKPVRKDDLSQLADNVIVGPGGLISGSYNADKKPDELVIKHLDHNKVLSVKGNNINFNFFSTGTNTGFLEKKKPFSNISSSVLSEIFNVSNKIFLRGHSDIMRLSGFGDSSNSRKFGFQPCPSVFLDELYGLTPKVNDKVAVNFPLSKIINKENAKTHPLNRFVKACEAHGLSAVFVDNHPDDFNPWVLDIFSEVAHKDSDISNIVNTFDDSSTVIQKVYTDIWTSHPCLARRYNGYRFAFGNRLHSFLPFMAFNTPSVFMSNHEIRRPMPIDYFNNAIFQGKIRLGERDFNSVVDGMIERLGFMIKNEMELRNEINLSRKKLWKITKLNQMEIVSNLV